MTGSSIRTFVLGALAGVLLQVGCGAGPVDIDYGGPIAEWRVTTGKGALHYSPLTQITPENVHALEVA
ncbi:MAG: hypothetical protein VX246_03580, partial [Myxococcota bacterium]|nr:hypothetical protein [Myxococcota bacterium]